MGQENIKTAKALLAWNKANLIRDSNLKKEDISQFFAPNFLIKANERTYAGNYDNYFEFLNQFRKTIDSGFVA